MSQLLITTPCTGLCSTVYGDVVCRGCKRFHHEIVNWNAYTDPERRAVLQRLEILLEQVMKERIRIVDAKLLRSQLDRHGIRYLKQASGYVLTYSLLKAGAGQIRDLHRYGLRLMPPFEGQDLVSLTENIDQAFLGLSQAHYDRYILPGLEF